MGNVPSAPSNPHLPVSLCKRSLTIMTITEPGSTPYFSPSTTKAVSDHIILPPGMVSNQHQAQAQQVPPPLSKVQQPLPSGSLTPQQQLHNTRSDSPLKFSVAPNGALSSFDQPAMTWPQHFPQQSTPQTTSLSPKVPTSPLSRPGAAQIPIVLNSVETDSASTNIVPPQPPVQQKITQPAFQPLPSPPGYATQNEALVQSTFSQPPMTGYPWSDPTTPGYRNPNPPAPSPPRPQKPPMTAAQKEQLVDSLARVAMTQARGNLIDEFVNFAAPDLVRQAIAQHLKDVEERNYRECGSSKSW